MAKVRASRKPINRLRLGTYRLGHRRIEVFLIKDKTGGSGVPVPRDSEALPRIEIGVADGIYDTFGTLMHEAFEFALNDLECGFVRLGQFDTETSNRWFMFNHEQLGEASQRVGYFLNDIIKDFLKAFRKLTKCK